MADEYAREPPPTRLAQRAQLRTAWTTEQGDVIRFMTQLEYWLDGDWRQVVRYDHDKKAPGGHDVTEEGLHLDIYREGEKVESKEVTGPIPANEAFEYAEDDLKKNYVDYLRRFEQWHDVKNSSDR